MKVSIAIGGAASGRPGEFEEQVEYVLEAEKLGVDTVWSAEAWGQDAVAPLAYLAARTERIRLGTGIMQISARTPSMTAMTALTMDSLSGGRFILGLGASGPQVVEGLQGRPFKAPLRRMRETVEIVRLAFAGEKLAYDGRYHQLPLPGRAGRARRCASPSQPTRTFPSTWPRWVRMPSSTRARRPTGGLAPRSRRRMRMPRTSTTSGVAPRRPAGRWRTSTFRTAAPLLSATTSTPWSNR